MSIDPVTAGIDLITSVVSRVWPDKTDEEKSKLAAAMAEDANLTALLTGQMEINAAEAANPSLFVAGWRPMVGWVCASAFAWQFVILPVFLFLAELVGHPVPTPAFDVGTMVTVLMGMLGLGSLRTYEKVKGFKDGR